MKKAVQFGAGNIGRGFLGQLFFESGYETTFVDVVEPLVAGLNERHSYPLRILDDVSYTMTIEMRRRFTQDQEAVARPLPRRISSDGGRAYTPEDRAPIAPESTAFFRE